jgi:hypothetical protein
MAGQFHLPGLGQSIRKGEKYLFILPRAAKVFNGMGFALILGRMKKLSIINFKGGKE